MAVLIFSVVALLCTLTLLATWLIPGWLEPTRMPVVRVREKMTSAERQGSGGQQFALLYDELDEKPVDSYLPGSKSGAHGFITTVARLNSVKGKIASAEDVLDDSPDPGNKLCINAQICQPVSVATVDVFLSRVRLGAAVMLAISSMAALFCHYRSRRNA